MNEWLCILCILIIGLTVHDPRGWRLLIGGGRIFFSLSTFFIPAVKRVTPGLLKGRRERGQIPRSRFFAAATRSTPLLLLLLLLLRER